MNASSRLMWWAAGVRACGSRIGQSASISHCGRRLWPRPVAVAQRAAQTATSTGSAPGRRQWWRGPKDRSRRRRALDLGRNRPLRDRHRRREHLATRCPRRAAAQAGWPGRARTRRVRPINFNNQTLRQVVHASIGGQRLRVVLSNAFGTAPLAVGAAQIALRDKESAIVPSSNRVLTFGGSPMTTIAAGAVALSDPVSLTVPALSRSRARSLSSRRHRFLDLAVDDAYGRAADELRIVGRQPRRRDRAAGGDDERLVVLPFTGRGHGSRADGRGRRVRRFDHRRHAFDAGHQQPLAGLPREAAGGAERANGRAQRGHRRQSRAGGRRRRQRARAVRPRRPRPDRRHAHHRPRKHQRHRDWTQQSFAHRRAISSPASGS